MFLLQGQDLIYNLYTVETWNIDLIQECCPPLRKIVVSHKFQNQSKEVFGTAICHTKEIEEMLINLCLHSISEIAFVAAQLSCERLTDSNVPFHHPNVKFNWKMLVNIN